MKNRDFLIFYVLFVSFALGLTSTSRCPPIKIRKDTIIRTKESINNGARMLFRTAIESSRECYEICCERKSCSVGIIHYEKDRDRSTGEVITSKTCFIFACGSPNRCIFMNHTGYAVIEMQREKVKPKTKKIEVVEKEKPIKEEDCPPGSPVAMCSDDPCKRATCPADKTARCVPNFCGGCHAFFYDKQAKRIQCRAHEHKTKAPTPQPTNAPKTIATEQQSEEVDSNNVNEEEVEIKPEDTGGRPTEDPNSPDEEDPHKVKEWRTWLDSGDDDHDKQLNATKAPTHLETKANDNKKGESDPANLDKSRKPTKVIESRQESRVTVTLAIALGVCLVILFAVIIKIKCTGPKKKKKFAVDDGDYLINGMYL